MDSKRLADAVKKVDAWVNALTVDSKENVVKDILSDEEKFFTWDNEKRTPLKYELLFDYSYYNGVIMEGLYDVYESDCDKYQRYYDYIKEFLDGLMDKNADGRYELNYRRSGYIDSHGADCYKTAALFERFSDGEDSYQDVCNTLYYHLTDEKYINSFGFNPATEKMPAECGHNYWHCWKSAPKYKIWLDGLYMLQPFIAHHAARICDLKQLELVNERLDWVAKNLLAPNGMYYHAANSKEDFCNFFWTRAIGWYGMAMVDCMEVLPEEYMKDRMNALKIFVDGMIKFQGENGIWNNMPDQPATATNRPETSGTAMIVYTILKGIRNGWLEESYKEAAYKAFVALCEEKLDSDGLHDIYLKAMASGENNYEITEYYLTNEGKGAGPFIMAYSEVLKSLS